MYSFPQGRGDPPSAYATTLGVLLLRLRLLYGPPFFYPLLLPICLIRHSRAHAILSQIRQTETFKISEELDRLLAHAAEVLPRLVLRTVEMLEKRDMNFEYGYVYRFGR